MAQKRSQLSLLTVKFSKWSFLLFCASILAIHSTSLAPIHPKTGGIFIFPSIKFILPTSLWSHPSVWGHNQSASTNSSSYDAVARCSRNAAATLLLSIQSASLKTGPDFTVAHLSAGDLYQSFSFLRTACRAHCYAQADFKSMISSFQHRFNKLSTCSHK